jgi:hypothetical protein
MRFTYDLNTNGFLILYADASEREALKGLANAQGEFTEDAEYQALESLLCNSELDWIRPEEIGALTSAPILGFRDKAKELPANVNPVFAHVVGHWNGKTWYEPVNAAWGFMDYAVRSFVSDLIETGKAVFVNIL